MLPVPIQGTTEQSQSVKHEEFNIQFRVKNHVMTGFFKRRGKTAKKNRLNGRAQAEQKSLGYLLRYWLDSVPAFYEVLRYR